MGAGIVNGSPLAGVTAAILAGGLGTRLRSAVADRPKALAAVEGRPFLSYQLDHLVQAGVRRAVVCTGYLGEMIEQEFGAAYRGMSLTYSREHQPLGTGGALRAALDRIAGDNVLALNGDSLCGADLPAMAAAHSACGAVGTLLLAHVDDASRFGRVECDAQGRITAYLEKQPLAAAGWINAGVYLFQRRLIESIPTGRPVSLERDILPQWIGQGLFGHCATGEFIDIGTPDSYGQIAAFVKRQTASAGQ
jgi:D-glycero-alpha-D-manno-heptose 1-phosphate guanylyltransferase